jgi:hypothetical protein
LVNADADGTSVNDVHSQLNPTRVRRVVTGVCRCPDAGIFAFFAVLLRFV